MTKSVLIVDDSIFIYEEIKYMLSDTDYRVIGYAKDGEQAIKMYAELKPDVVTMDIILPGDNGIDISKTIINRWPDARVVVVTSLAYDSIKEEADGAGVCGFIFKPMEKDSFVKALDQAVGRDSE